MTFGGAVPSVCHLHTIKTALRSILYYITGHGYGHAVRSTQVIRALHQAAPDIRIHVRTTAPEWLFSVHPIPVSYSRQSIDIGVLQPDSLHMDLTATFQACRDLHSHLPVVLEQEVSFIKSQGIDLIIGDIPPAAFEIAARANIPSAAVTNFTWDVIYRAYAGEHPGFIPLIEKMTGSYSKATMALVLPYPCDMSMFPRRKAIPWITRVSALTKARARTAFGLPQSATIVLLSFGGIGLDLPWQLFDETDFFFVATGPAEKSRKNLLVLDGTQRHYEDLLRAVDGIVTKPGYGIVADVLAHHLPVLYTERGEFAEYPFLVQALNDLAMADFIPQDELLGGNIGPYLRRLLKRQQFWPPVELNGANVAAANILSLLGHA